MREQGADEIRFVRREILLRIGIQNTILILLMPLLLLSIIAASALRSEAAFIALAYVGVAGMGALYWIHSAARTVQIKAYLRAVEKAGGAGGWETWLAENPVRGVLGSRWFISTKGVFVGSQVAAILVCGLLAGGVEQPILLGLALGISALTAALLTQPKMPG
jgi:hypothetical protein